MGTSHSLATLLGGLSIAVAHNVTLHVQHSKMGHRNILGHLVGHAFVHQHISDCKIMRNVTWRRSSFRADMEAAISSGRYSCAADLEPEACVAIVADGTPPFVSRGYNKTVVTPLRELFDGRERRRKAPRDVPRPLRIDVHIRRGDLFYYLSSFIKPGTEKQSKAALQRLVPNEVYTQLINDVAHHVNRVGWAGDVNITFHCEGAKPPASVLDVSGNYTDYGKLLQSAGLFGAGQVHVRLGPANARAAFDSMCSSDVLLGGGSGFTSVAGLFCTRPLKLVLPWTAGECSHNTYLLAKARNKSYPVKGSRKRLTLVSHLEPPPNLGALVEGIIGRLKGEM